MSSQAMSHNDLITGPSRKLAEEGSELHSTAADLLGKTQKGLQKWEGKLEDKIREHPVRSVLIAAGVGATVGLVLGVMVAKR